MKKNLRSKLTISIIIYVFLIIIAFPVDVIFIRRLDEWIGTHMPEWATLPFSFALAVVVGVTSYLLYLWQIRQMVKRERTNSENNNS